METANRRSAGRASGGIGPALRQVATGAGGLGKERQDIAAIAQVERSAADGDGIAHAGFAA